MASAGGTGADGDRREGTNGQDDALGGDGAGGSARTGIAGEAIVLTEKLGVAPQVSLQALDDGGVLLRCDTGELYTVNDTALALLRRLDGLRPLSDILDEMAEEYDVPRGELESDMLEILAALKSEQLVAVAG